jgi:hypothetical protein
MIDPKQYMEDPKGRLVPIEVVKELDKSRDELVRKLVADAWEVQNTMARFKQVAMDEVRAFIDLAAQEWDVTLGGKKGNITLYSFNGRYKVQIQVSDNLVFDEQLQVAKKMIDQCLTEWTDGNQARPEIKAIINDAFQVDQEGRINTKRILSLRRLDIKDKLWLKAMDAITASLQVIGSKEYIRLYQRRNADAPWQAIVLDMAAL